MKQLYLDCGMGAAGDMLAAALLELFDDPAQMTDRLNALGIPGVRFCLEKSVKCGITGSHLQVLVDGMEEHCHHHSHSTLADIAHIISHLQVCQQVREDILCVYRLLADAESQVHGVSVKEIHFHEVGTLDAIADIAAVSYLLYELKPERISASPVHVGCGQVKCAHGLLPVPAPATACLLKDVPIYGGQIQGELCTPTGAALLKHFVSDFGPMAPMRTTAIGYGLGRKDFPAANCVRAMLGQTQEDGDTVFELSCNLDDMTGEAIAFAAEQLFRAGALDVFTTFIGMKKGRPGTMLIVLCKPNQKDSMVRLIFRHTTTLGIRQCEKRRYTLERSTETVQTPYGPVRKKTASGYGITRSKYEYEDLAQIALREDLPLNEIIK